MNEMEALQRYLKQLYEGCEALETDYKRLHKRSKMHNEEGVEAYYLRWKEKMRTEIRRTEMMLAKKQ